MDSETQETAPVEGPAGAPETQSRLMITRMVLENFKSYAGAITIGPFDKNMTSVVGPNGSGKSNVIDAMLFVFGKKAKQMRQAKVSDLIHSSDRHPDMQYCKVQVHFQDIIDRDDGGYDVVEGSQLVVSREARRDNSSKYWVGSKVSTWKDVTVLLRTRGIDLDHNRFLILQGEVEQIAMMKPKALTPSEEGLIEYLEDIIGSNRHEEPIKEAHTEIEQLNEQRNNALNALKAVESQVQGLEGGKAEAEEFISTEARLHAKKSAFYQKNAAECQRVIVEVEAKRAETEKVFEDEKAKAKLNLDKLSGLEREFKASKKVHDKVAAQVERSRAEFQKFEREDIKNREESKHLKTQLRKAQAAVEKETRKMGEVKGVLANLQEDVPRIEGEEQALSATIQREEAELQVLYEGFKGQTEPIRKKIEQKQREREPEAQKLASLQSDEQLVRSELQLLEEKQAGGKAALEAAEEELLAHGEQGERARADLRSCEESRQEDERKLQALAAQESEAQAEEASLVDEGSAARAKFEAGKAATTEFRSSSGLLQAIMKAKADGSIPGVIGRLGSLGTIPQAYDCAISTACGSLDHIVVADTSTAQKCVELLRQKKLGVATFIALDRQSHLKPRMKPIKAPEGSQRLFDMIQCPNPEHLPAFYFGLSDTLVCDDRALASKIAVGGSQRWRVVTTDGVLINSSGTMEGGGKPLRGRMGGQVATEAMSEAELAKLSERASKVAARLEEVRATLAEAQTAQRSLKKHLAQQNTAHKKLSMALAAAATQRAALEQRVESARAEAGLSEAELKQVGTLQGQLKAAEKLVEAQQKVVGVADAALEKLQEQVLEIGGIKLRAQKSKVETLGEQLASKQAALTKARVDCESRTREERKLQASIEKAQAGIAELEAKIVAQKEAMAELEKDAVAVLEAFQKCEEELAIKEEEMTAMRQKYEDFKSVVARVRTVEVELSSQIEDLTRSLSEHGSKVKHWAQKLQTLREAAAESAAMLAGATAEAGEGAAAETGEGAAASSGEGLPELSGEELEALDVAELQVEMAELEEAIKSMSPNLNLIAEYHAKHKEWQARLADFDGVTEQRDATRRKYEELRKLRLTEFMTGFRIIGLRLKEMYQMITLGGDAELELVDSLDPFTEGIVFSVRPPKKSWKNISNLSGGEKTLSSLALVFALHHYKPTPLYVMDEIDAALDFRNVSIVGNYIKERTRNAQFVIISLRNNMFELADRLVGIYKTNDCTKSVAIDPAAFTLPANRVC